jgi:uncharacterized membrane protein
MKELSATLNSGSSTLFVLLRRATSHGDKVLEELKGTGGRIAAALADRRFLSPIISLEENPSPKPTINL